MRRGQPAIRLEGPPLGTASPPFGSEGRARHGQPAIRHKTR